MQLCLSWTNKEVLQLKSALSPRDIHRAEQIISIHHLQRNDFAQTRAFTRTPTSSSFPDAKMFNEKKVETMVENLSFEGVIWEQSMERKMWKHF